MQQQEVVAVAAIAATETDAGTAATAAEPARYELRSIANGHSGGSGSIRIPIPNKTKQNGNYNHRNRSYNRTTRYVNMDDPVMVTSTAAATAATTTTTSRTQQLLRQGTSYSDSSSGADSTNTSTCPTDSDDEAGNDVEDDVVDADYNKNLDIYQNSIHHQYHQSLPTTMGYNNSYHRNNLRDRSTSHISNANVTSNSLSSQSHLLRAPYLGAMRREPHTKQMASFGTDSLQGATNITTGSATISMNNNSNNINSSYGVNSNDDSPHSISPLPPSAVEVLQLRSDLYGGSTNNSIRHFKSHQNNKNYHEKRRNHPISLSLGGYGSLRESQGRYLEQQQQQQIHHFHQPQPAPNNHFSTIFSTSAENNSMILQHKSVQTQTQQPQQQQVLLSCSAPMIKSNTSIVSANGTIANDQDAEAMAEYQSPSQPLSVGERIYQQTKILRQKQQQNPEDHSHNDHNPQDQPQSFLSTALQLQDNTNDVANEQCMNQVTFSGDNVKVGTEDVFGAGFAGVDTVATVAKKSVEESEDNVPVVAKKELQFVTEDATTTTSSASTINTGITGTGCMYPNNPYQHSDPQPLSKSLTGLEVLRQLKGIDSGVTNAVAGGVDIVPSATTSSAMFYNFANGNSAGTINNNNSTGQRIMGIVGGQLHHRLSVSYTTTTTEKINNKITMAPILPNKDNSNHQHCHHLHHHHFLIRQQQDQTPDLVSQAVWNATNNGHRGSFNSTNNIGAAAPAVGSMPHLSSSSLMFVIPPPQTPTPLPPNSFPLASSLSTTSSSIWISNSYDTNDNDNDYNNVGDIDSTNSNKCVLLPVPNNEATDETLYSGVRTKEEPTVIATEIVQTEEIDNDEDDENINYNNNNDDDNRMEGEGNDDSTGMLIIEGGGGGGGVGISDNTSSPFIGGGASNIPFFNYDEDHRPLSTRTITSLNDHHYHTPNGANDNNFYYYSSTNHNDSNCNNDSNNTNVTNNGNPDAEGAFELDF